MATESHQPATDAQNASDKLFPVEYWTKDDPAIPDTWNPGETAPPKAITFAVTLVCIPEPTDTREGFAAAVADDLRNELIQIYHVPAITLVGMVDTENPGD